MEPRIPFRRRAAYAYMALQYEIEGLAYRLGWRLPSGVLPHAVKRRVLHQYARDFDLRILVETGTYLGDMMAAMARDFDELHTIELSELLYERAKLRLARKANVHLHQGDSGVQLQRVLNVLRRPALFWLDAHYSGGITARAAVDTPISSELGSVLSHEIKGHVILIDDAREFRNENGYPAIDALCTYVRQVRPDYAVAVADDIIRITPAERA